VEHVGKVRNIAKKYPEETPESMRKLLNELEFRLKFLKVSYPGLDFNAPPKPDNQAE
jgi:hypothetical protein